MGLDTSHDCWHGSYGAFTRFRNKLALAGGYELLPKDADGFVSAALPWDSYKEHNYYGEWDEIPEDPLLLLIVHSDCEGVIKSAHAEILAKRIEEIAPRLEDYGGGHLPSPRSAALQFAAGLRRAADAGEDVDFH